MKTFILFFLLFFMTACGEKSFSKVPRDFVLVATIPAPTGYKVVSASFYTPPGSSGHISILYAPLVESNPQNLLVCEYRTSDLQTRCVKLPTYSF